jgi:hypothetical protein
MKRLPKKFQGADVVRGLGMDSNVLDALVKKKSLNQFDATKEIFLVVENDALKDDFFASSEVRCFADQATAVRYARAMAHGNVDYRVLRVSGQTLVVATDNEL